jgi:hypothetical protein
VVSKDFNGNGKPDYLLYNAATRQTAIWYLNNNVFVNGVFGPHSSGWLELGRALREATLALIVYGSLITVLAAQAPGVIMCPDDRGTLAPWPKMWKR